MSRNPLMLLELLENGTPQHTWQFTGDQCLIEPGTYPSGLGADFAIAGQLHVSAAGAGAFSVSYSSSQQPERSFLVKEGESFTVAARSFRCRATQPAIPGIEAGEPTAPVVVLSHDTGKISYHDERIGMIEFLDERRQPASLLLQQTVTLLGRHPECDLRFADPLAAERHAMIREQQAGSFVIEDQQSENGTFVNRRLIHRAELAANDEIIIGNTALTFRFVPPAASNQAEALMPASHESYAIFQAPHVLRHELKNYLQLLAEHCSQLMEKSGRVPTAVHRIDATRKRMEELLTLFRSVSFCDQIASHDLDRAMLEILMMFEAGCRQQNIAIQTELVLQQPIEFAASAMNQVFINLIRNAIEAMPDGGTLHLATAVSQKTVQVRIADTGSGIAPELADRMFQPLVTTKPQGSGLGLYVSAYIARQHNGAITYRNLTTGGAEFTVCWPVKARRIHGGSISA